MCTPKLYLSKYFLSLAVVSLLLSSCGVYFHDEGLREVAESAQEKAGALNLPSVIATARENRKKLADQQVTLLQRSGTLRADLRLAQAVTDKRPMALSVWGSKAFTAGLGALGVTDNATLEALDAAYGMTARWEFRLRSRARRVELFLGIMPTPCLPVSMFPSPDDFKVNGQVDTQAFRDGVTQGLIEAVAEDERETFKLIYADYVQTCNGIKSEIDAVLRPIIYVHDEKGNLARDNNGNPVRQENIIASRWHTWQAEEVALEEKRAVARNKLVALKAAKLEFKKATAPGPDPADKITEAAKKLRTAVKGFDVICEIGATLSGLASGNAEADANLFSNSIICGEKRKVLDQLIEAVATGHDPTAADAPRSLKNAAIIAAALPGLVGDVGAVLEAGRKVPLARLMLLRAHASIDKDFADRKVERQEARVRQAMLAWRATMAEAHHL